MGDEVLSQVEEQQVEEGQDQTGTEVEAQGQEQEKVATHEQQRSREDQTANTEIARLRQELQQRDETLNTLAADPFILEAARASQLSRQAQARQPDPETIVDMQRIEERLKAGDLPGFVKSLQASLAKGIIPVVQEQARQVTQQQLMQDMAPHLISQQWDQSKNVEDIRHHKDVAMSLFQAGVPPNITVDVLRKVALAEQNRMKAAAVKRGGSFLESPDEGSVASILQESDAQTKTNAYAFWKKFLG